MFVKVVFIDELLRNFAEIDADIFEAVQWILEVKVLDVKGEILGDLAREENVDCNFEHIK